jgi:hypothetical protein
VIRKHVRDAGDGPADFSYWRREPLAYASGLLADLAGVAAPRCLAQGEEPGGVVLWLEDLGGGAAGWTVQRYARVARALGMLGGDGGSAQPVPDWPWLSRGFLASWVEQAAAGFEVFADAVRDPLLARLYPADVAAVMAELWQARGRICALLASWPQVLGHLDAVPANVIVRDGQAYLIDWAFTDLRSAWHSLSGGGAAANAVRCCGSGRHASRRRHLGDRLAGLPDQPDRALPAISAGLVRVSAIAPPAPRATCPRCEGAPAPGEPAGLGVDMAMRREWA